MTSVRSKPRWCGGFVIWLLLIAGAVCLPSRTATASGAVPKLPEAGFRSIGVWAAETGLRMDLAVWYPTRRAARAITIEGWRITVAKDSPPIPARYPVILISHDSAASRFATHDLAAFLARHGFIVIAPTHSGDNVYDTGRLFRAGIFAERPYHIIAALEAASASPVIGPLIDKNRMGLLGVGSGAATVLQLAGAEPDLTLLDNYCVQENLASPLCSAWAKAFHPRMQREFTQLTEQAGAGLFTPVIPQRQAASSQLATPSESTVSQKAALPQGMPTPEPEASPLAGRRAIRALGLLAPGQIELFPDQSLRAITIPVGIVAAADDTLYPLATGMDRLQNVLSHRPALKIAQRARHADLLPLCPPLFTDSFQALCGREGPNASGARSMRDNFFVRFYQRSLGQPIAEPATPST